MGQIREAADKHEMNGTYLGVLDHADPLYEILLTHVHSDVRKPLFHVSRLGPHRVYRYTEEKTQTSIIGKFFSLEDTSHDRISRIMGEYDNLNKIRGYGFDTYPNYVVRPISRDERIGLALTEEFVKGKNLVHYMQEAIYRGGESVLKEILRRLAAFLSELHTRTQTGDTVGTDFVAAYFLKILNKLVNQTVITEQEKETYTKLMDKWLNTRMLDSTGGVIIHGDATPTNFIFTEKEEVVAIDLERMKICDPAFDVGMVCGELKHAFLSRTGNPCAAEPFIGHFLKSYSCCFPDSEKAFEKITSRNPYYMAMTELRIARNDYLGWKYRKRLAHEAMECLRWGLQPG